MYPLRSPRGEHEYCPTAPVELRSLCAYIRYIEMSVFNFPFPSLPRHNFFHSLFLEVRSLFPAISEERLQERAGGRADGRTSERMGRKVCRASLQGSAKHYIPDLGLALSQRAMGGSCKRILRRWQLRPAPSKLSFIRDACMCDFGCHSDLTL